MKTTDKAFAFAGFILLAGFVMAIYDDPALSDPPAADRRATHVTPTPIP